MHFFENFPEVLSFLVNSFLNIKLDFGDVNMIIKPNKTELYYLSWFYVIASTGY